MNNTLKNSVIRKVGKEACKDIAEHGIDGGFNGFIYTVDTCRFFRRHKKAIVELAESLAQNIGEEVLTMIQGFKCVGKDYSISEIGKVLYGSWKDDDVHTMIGNAMAWFAAEEAAREVVDNN
jgi:hypothetical protein